MRRPGPTTVGVLVAASTLLSACTAAEPETGPAPAETQSIPATSTPTTTSTSTTTSTTSTPSTLTTATTPSDRPSEQPLRGTVIVIDPGHQLGNARHPSQINRLVDAGGFTKACNTTGTATNSGFPEAAFTWKVAAALRTQLRRRGATVVMTRQSNAGAAWGPCIDDRGRLGNQVHADAVVSIHGDGADASTHGFFVIMPSDRPGWTDDIYRPSRALGHRIKGGLLGAGLTPSSSYGGDGLDIRSDLGTLNWSNRPIVMVELGNMRNPIDARHMTSPQFRRHVYARGLRMGLSDFVRTH